MIQKRGISPLIATVLLIGFTVVLAGIIFTWGQGWFGTLTEGTTQSTSLQQACINKGGLTVSDVCDDGTDIRIAIINTGSEDYTMCSVIGGGLSAGCLNDGITLDVGDVNITYLNIGTLTDGSKISTVFKIQPGTGDEVTCQGSSYIVPTGGLNDC